MTKCPRVQPQLFGPLTLCLGLLGCQSDKPVKCLFSGQTALTENPVTQLADTKLLPAGENFVLAGLDGTTVHWAPLSKAGVVGAASNFMLTQTTVIPPQLAVTARTAAGDQVVAVYGTSNAENQILIQVVSQFAGEAATAPATLATLPAGLNLADLRLTVGSSRTGQRALVAWGLVNQPGTKIEVRILGADAVPIPGGPVPLDIDDNWNCLQFVPGRADWALSWLLEPANSNSRFVIQEGQDLGTTGNRYRIGMNTKETTCPVVAPSERGYVLSFQTRSGTWVSDFELLTNIVSSEFVAAGVRFGTPDEQPPVGGVASMGMDVAVLFGVTKGPEVMLFNPFGRRVGSQLKLPANVGNVGTVSSWPAGAAIYTTYREGLPVTPGASAGPRWFMKIECPAG